MFVRANFLGELKSDEVWSVRRKIGTALGSETVINNMKEIRNRYELGNHDKGKEMGGAQMKYALELKIKIVMVFQLSST